MPDHKEEYTHAIEKGRGTLWLMWLIPIFAILMAGGLLYKHYLNKGVEIVVTFDDGKGIEVDKTPLIFQGIQLGKVTGVHIDTGDINKIVATITVNPDAAPYVTRDGNKFVKVEPKITLTEISGLDTILNGVYIEIFPAAPTKEKLLKQPIRTHFEGLDHFPPKRFEKGLYLTLLSEDGSLSLNGPVLYKHFVVGHIVDKNFAGDKIKYTLLIEERFRHLVNASSKFWQLSGIEVKASLAGVKVRFDSLATLLAGGIAFDTIDSQAAPPKQSYKLYPSKFDTHLDDTLITIVADKAYHLDPAFSNVVYKGFNVGKIVDSQYDTDKHQTIFTVRISKKFIHLANEKAWFWIVKPVVGIRQIKGLDAIVSGPYIAFDTADIQAKRRTRFILHDQPMPRKGRHIHLEAKLAESLKPGTAIFYKDIPIGEITSIDLKPNHKTLDIDALIYDRYKQFLNDSSMFYVKSGIEAQLSLQGFYIDTSSLEAMVVGGISMVTLEPHAPSQKKRFFLYRNYKAFKKARYLAAGGAFYHILMPQLGALEIGSPILYKRMKAGEVINYRYLPDSDTIDVVVFIAKDFKRRINASTRFENISDIELKMNFPDLSLKMGPVKNLLNGGLLFTTPDPEAPKVASGHRFKLFDETLRTTMHYIRFDLWMNGGHGLKKGSRLLYKGLPVGHVETMALMNNMVKATLLLDKRYTHLLKPDTLFWLETFQMDLEGVRNVANAITGPAVVMTPGNQPGEKRSFLLSSAPPPPTYGKPGLRVVVKGDRCGSLHVGSPVFYRQIPIGSVESLALGQDATSVDMTLYIEPRYARLVRETSKFYIAGAIGVDVSLLGVKIRTETLKTMIAGGIGLVTPDQPGQTVTDGHTFKLYGKPEASWLAWKPHLL